MVVPAGLEKLSSVAELKSVAFKVFNKFLGAPGIVSVVFQAASGGCAVVAFPSCPCSGFFTLISRLGLFLSLLLFLLLIM